MSDLRACPECGTLQRSVSPSEIIEAALNDFPTDEDVEIAAEAMVEDIDYSWDMLTSNDQTSWKGHARAALQAVADARRTEEEM